jgi:hypothetical protein
LNTSTSQTVTTGLTYGLTAANQVTRAELYSLSGSATAPNAAAGLDTHCPAVGGVQAAEPDPNIWINDLKANNFIGVNTLNRLFAKHIGEDMIFVGSWGDTASGESYNAMVITNVPAPMAMRFMKSINGSDATTDNGAVRVITGESAGTYVASAFGTGGTAIGSVVNLVYFYRNQPRTAS